MILHRDISENNIIIVGSATEGSPKGLLIDLDLAKELDSIPSGATHRTGTMQFMAIEVLQGKGHTYRHDLESFFYVFVWMCIRHNQVAGLEAEKKSRHSLTSRLRRWYTGTFPEIANTKFGHLDKNIFENIVAEFVPNFEALKPLARELRSVLSAIKDGAIFTGTYRNQDIMYGELPMHFTRSSGRQGRERVGETRAVHLHGEHIWKAGYLNRKRKP